MLFLKIWSLPTGFNLKWLANFFSLPKLKICGLINVFKHVCAFRCYGLKLLNWLLQKIKNAWKKCSSTQVFPYPPSCSKEAYKTGSNFLYLPFFSAQKALWGWWYKMVACPRVQRKLVLVLQFGRQLYLACISPKVIPTSLKKFDEQDWLQFLICNLNSPKKLTCRLWAS